MKDTGFGYRKDNIAAYLKEYTESRISRRNADIPGLDASDIALGLSLDRANVSRDLNELYRDGVVIKLLGKPTRYLHYHTVAGHFSEQYIPNTIPIGRRLEDYIANKMSVKAGTVPHRQEATLADSRQPSLWRAAIQAEAAVHYPPHGLHTLLAGPNGSGKYAFAKQVFAYGKAIGKFSPDAKLFSFDAHSLGSSVQGLMIQLFGCAAGVISPSAPSRKGLVERAEGSILLLSEAQALPISVQEKLMGLIMYGTFTRVGEASVNRQGRLMLMAVCGGPASQLPSSPLLRYFPMQIAMPPLWERTVSERFLYLNQAFQLEAEALDCKIHVSKDVFYFLLCTTCSGDFINLRGNIKSICSMACREGFSDSNEHVLQIEYRHLPLSVLACSAAPADTAAFHAVLDSYPQEYIFIHANSVLPPILPPEVKNPPQTGGRPPASSGLLFIQNYLDQYLLSASRLPGFPFDRNPLLSAHILRGLSQDPLLGALGGEDVVIQGLISLLTETIHTDANYQLLQIPDEAALLSKIPQELRLMAISLERDISRLMDQKNTSRRGSLIALYLFLVKNRIETSRIFMIFLFHGKGVSLGLADYIRALYSCSIIPLDFDKNSTSQSLLSEIDDAVSALPANSQILLFSDGLPFQTIHTYIEETYSFHIKSICGATFETILKTVRNIVLFHFTLDMIDDSLPCCQERTAAPAASIVRQAVQSVLLPSLTFLDVGKVSPLLEDSLGEINRLLKLVYSDNISIRYQFHCAHMIERLIRKEPLNYPHLKTLVNLHSNEFCAIGEALQPIAQSYGIKIPDSEIAYLVEIFLAI